MHCTGRYLPSQASCLCAARSQSKPVYLNSAALHSTVVEGGGLVSDHSLQCCPKLQMNFSYSCSIHFGRALAASVLVLPNDKLAAVLSAHLCATVASVLLLLTVVCLNDCQN